MVSYNYEMKSLWACSLVSGFAREYLGSGAAICQPAELARRIGDSGEDTHVPPIKFCESPARDIRPAWTLYVYFSAWNFIDPCANDKFSLWSPPLMHSPAADFRSQFSSVVMTRHLSGEALNVDNCLGSSRAPNQPTFTNIGFSLWGNMVLRPYLLPWRCMPGR